MSFINLIYFNGNAVFKIVLSYAESSKIGFHLDLTKYQCLYIPVRRLLYGGFNHCRNYKCWLHAVVKVVRDSS